MLATEIWGVFTTFHLEKIKPGIELFNQKQYWECHEVLEEPWYEDQSDPVRFVYWAVIQAAASLHHVQNNNIVGAVGMMMKAQDKLLKCEQFKVDSPLLEETLNWSQFKKLAMAIHESSTLADFASFCQFQFPAPK